MQHKWVGFNGAMMTNIERPSLEEFLQAPAAQVALVAPRTIMFAAGGTRRAAVLHNIAIDDVERLAAFSIQQFATTAGRMFALGVQHILALTVHGKQLSERGVYRDYIIGGTELTVGDLGMPYYRELGCRVRFVGHEDVPELARLAARLDAATSQNGPHTIWWMASASNESVWRRTLAAAQGAHSQAEVIRRYFGADLPPAELFLSYGKPFFSPEIMPLALIGGEVHSYFCQRPGYALSERELREIFYDYAYLRRTWVQDKTRRYDEVPAQRALWERQVVLGLGRRVGSFWYPRLGEADASE
jgi:hypothetical protein